MRKIDFDNITQSQAKDLYDTIISEASSCDYNPDGAYTEKHHIVPKCMGGTDAKENIVRLLASDHITVHILLTIMYPDNQSLLFSAMSMTKCFSEYTKGRKLAIESVDVEVAAKLREKYSKSRIGMKFSEEHRKHISEAKKGIKLPPFTEEHKRKMSEALKGRVMSKEARQKISIAGKGRKHTEETKSKMSKTRTGMIRSEEHCKAISEGLKKSDKLFRKKVQGPDGTVYRSIREASRLSGEHRKSINRWLNDPEHKRGWYLL